MSKLLWYFNRIRSMDGSEVLWRVRSLSRDLLDLVRLPLKLYPHLTRTSYHAYRTMQPGFSCTPVDKARWTSSQTVAASNWEHRLFDKAEKLLVNRLDYFDLDDHFHGDPINWHRDHSANIDAPQSLSPLIDYRDFKTVGDCKLVWEPNRHHQLVVLARAFKATGEFKFARKIAQLLDSWHGANPFGFGMNWRSPLEIGIRLINWIFAIDMIRAADVFSQYSWNNTLEMIYLSCWDIQRKFSQGSSANNHLIGEAAGVYIAMSYFPDLNNASTWREHSKQILEREILLQSYDDGCTREHAFGYQVFVLQFFSLCAIVGNKTGDEFSSAFLQRLHQMYRFMSEISQDTGTAPNSGDKDDGYVLDLGELPDQLPQLLSVGRLLFDDTTLGDQQPSETAYWLFGQSGRTDKPGKQPLSSTAFDQSGYYLLRSNRGTSPASRISVLVDCAELGFGAIAAHGHADCLSFVLNIDDRCVVVDSGTYDYFSHPEWRSYFRQTRAHNTVEIDGLCQSVSLGPFLWGQRANPRVINWHDDSAKSTLTAEHDGYSKLADPVIHRREITLEKASCELTIVDRFAANSSHEAKLHFHIHPDCKVSSAPANTAKIECGDATLLISPSDGVLSLQRATEGEHLGWISEGYHSMRPSTCIVIDALIDGPTELTTHFRLE
jgi:hypothetical protein